MKNVHWLALALAGSLLFGCGARDAATPSGGSSDGGSETADNGEGDPCGLLEIKEVEAAIGPLAGPPYRLGMDGPEQGGPKCAYDTKDLHQVTVDVTWSGGESIMRMLGLPAAAADQAGLRGKLPLPGGVTLAGEWDEAKALSCCEITALLGEQVVAIDFMATSLTTSQGADLLNLALRRLQNPLKVDGNAGVAAAAAREAAAAGRPRPVPACALFTAADAAALLGEPVDTLPEDHDTKCEYRAKAAPRLVGLSVEWRGGYRKWRSDRDIGGKVMGALFGDAAKPGVAEGGAAPGASAYPGPWEMADMVVTDFVAVKRDVIVRVDMRGTTLEKAQKIMTTAMSRAAPPPG